MRLPGWGAEREQKSALSLGRVSEERKEGIFAPSLNGDRRSYQQVHAVLYLSLGSRGAVLFYADT